MDDPARASRAAVGRGVAAAIVGTRGIFADGGFSEVHHPTHRRVVMRIDFEPPA